MMFSNWKNVFKYIEYSVIFLVVFIALVVWFLTYSDNKKEVRDTVRIYQINEITRSLEENYTINTIYPTPDDFIEIKNGDKTLTKQGYYGKNVSTEIWMFEMFDPNEKSPVYFTKYTYSVNADNSLFQVMSFMEKTDDETLKTSNKRYPLSSGKDVGILVDAEKNIPVQWLKTVFNISDIKTTYFWYFWPSIKLEINKDNYKAFTMYWKETTFTSCKDILDVWVTKNGFYYINPNGRKLMRVYCDLTSDGGGWTRLYYKQWKETCFNDENKFTTDIVSKLLTKDFAVSNKLDSLDSEGSWLLLDIDKKHENFSYSKLAKLANCTTPDGTAWTNDYYASRFSVIGTLKTLGKWKTMFYGCEFTRKIWDKVHFNIWWMNEVHSWEFIHSICNNYSGKENSITSRWDWDNTRTMWVR